MYSDAITTEQQLSLANFRHIFMLCFQCVLTRYAIGCKLSFPLENSLEFYLDKQVFEIFWERMPIEE